MPGGQDETEQRRRKPFLTVNAWLFEVYRVGQDHRVWQFI